MTIRRSSDFHAKYGFVALRATSFVGLTCSSVDKVPLLHKY